MTTFDKREDAFRPVTELPRRRRSAGNVPSAKALL